MNLIDKDALVEKLKDWRGDKDDIDTTDDAVYYNAMSRAIRLAEGAPTISTTPEWISVKDRLPEVGKVVLAYTCYQTFEFVKLTRRERTTFITTRGPDWWDGMDILYWMPLPEAPKEEEG